MRFVYSICSAKKADLLALVGVNCIFVTFPCGILGQVWYLIVSFPDILQSFFFFDIIKGHHISKAIVSINNKNSLPSFFEDKVTSIDLLNIVINILKVHYSFTGHCFGVCRTWRDM